LFIYAIFLQSVNGKAYGSMVGFAVFLLGHLPSPKPLWKLIFNKQKEPRLKALPFFLFIKNE
jgi:hypothetical protein